MSKATPADTALEDEIADLRRRLAEAERARDLAAQGTRLYHTLFSSSRFSWPSGTWKTPTTPSRSG